MSVFSLLLSIFATIISVGVTLRDKWNERFSQSTSIIAVVSAYITPARDSYVLVDAVTSNQSSVDFAITSAHLWIETKPMITAKPGVTRLPEQNYYGIVPSFVMWTLTTRSGSAIKSEIHTVSDKLPVIIPAHSAVHYRIAIATPEIEVPEKFKDGISISLGTSRPNKSITLSREKILPKLQLLEKYMTTPRRTIRPDSP